LAPVGGEKAKSASAGCTVKSQSDISALKFGLGIVVDDDESSRHAAVRLKPKFQFDARRLVKH
jgi:hypothetical protein